MEDFNLRQRIVRIRKNMKHFANIFLAFSLFIILNDCVGLSSAPFYSTHVKCKLMEPTIDCQALKTLASGTYLSEMVGGFFLVMQSILIYYFNDNFASSTYSAASTALKTQATAKPVTQRNRKRKQVDIPVIKKIIKTLLTVYLVILIVRVILYTQILKYYATLTSLSPSKDNHFGMFLGNVFENKGVAILATFLIIVLIIICFSLSVTAIKYLTEIETIMAQRLQLQSESENLNSVGSFGSLHNSLPVRRHETDYSSSIDMQVITSRSQPTSSLNVPLLLIEEGTIQSSSNDAFQKV